MIDWTNQNRVDEIVIELVDPNNLNRVRDTLDNVIVGNSSLDFGYYTDTRVSGSIETIDDNYDGTSFLRIVHSVKGTDYKKPLATLAVSSDDGSINKNSIKKTYECKSALAMLEKDYIPDIFSIGIGAYAFDVISKTLSGASRPYLINNSANNYRYSEAKTYELGDSRLSNLFDMCDISNNRIDVDGNGYVTVDKYISPSNKNIKYIIDLADERTNVIDGINFSSDKFSVPNMVIAKSSTKTDDEEKPFWGYAVSSGEYSRAKRGYTICEIVEVDKVDPQNSAGASAYAQKKLEELSAPTNEWTLSLLYLPLNTGDTVSLEFQEEDEKVIKKCMVKNISLNLGTMVEQVTLKEV